jgi:hypothetical protein
MARCRHRTPPARLSRDDDLLQKSLSHLDSLPATSENLVRRLDALSHLGGVLLIVKGLTAPEVEGTLSRAREVCGLVDDA